MNTASLHQRSAGVSRRQCLKGLGAGVIAIAVGAAWMAGTAIVGGVLDGGGGITRGQPPTPLRAHVPFSSRSPRRQTL